MTVIQAVCVFCGSSTPPDPQYATAARELGTLLARRGLELVYGGASVGLMGELADAALAAGGRVTGVIPAGLFAREVAHPGLSELHQVSSMHERKALMYERADGFVALPGGLGTLDELAETATWSQLGLHAKPLVLLDVAGFWDPLITLLDQMASLGLVPPASRARFRRAGSAAGALAELGAGTGQRQAAPGPG